jgi:hypothetical protein
MAGGKSDEGRPSGFTVSDRRIFSEGGGAEAAPTPAPADPPQEAPAASQPTEGSGASSPSVPAGTPELPPVDFHTFILSLGSSALLHLGELEHPEGGAARVDLPLAKHTIDIIAMLQEKTKGNLTPPEERLIESLLYDLRLRFVERSKT